ncbi:MAG TPA: sulfatase-like hydrolase/transferase [Bacteroidales bacterium]|nr:sulfatase-like hydrolase/transferase [Bacteroidales bacterium]
MKITGIKMYSPILIAASLFHPWASKAEQKSEKPNIIFILVDDLRWDAMGFTGKYPFLKTPNIDQLRKEGVHFVNAFCTHSLSAPSRATILTGMFSHTHGVTTNQEGREFNTDKTPSFSQLLQENGYVTAFIGKWHMAENNKPRKGFDYWCSFTGQGNYYGNILNINGKEVRNEGYITDELNKYALEFIEKNADKRFCIYLSHKAVHGPFTPHERHSNLYMSDLVPEPPGWRDNMENKPAWQKRIQPNMAQRERLRDKDMNKIIPVNVRKYGLWPAETGIGMQKNYLRCISGVDDGLGEIYDLLSKKGILNNTIIVFAGDNGFFHGEHGLGDKRLAYNESMRIPLVMRYPKLAKASQSVSEMVLNADIAPTFLDITGIDIPEQMQGKSLVPLLRGKNEVWRKSFLYTYWPDLIYFIPRIVAIRTEQYLYSTTPDINDIDELYDELNDPYELNNLAENPNYSEIKNLLAKELGQLKMETGYSDNVPRPDPEPVLKVKTGKLLSVDFSKMPFNAISEKGISLNGVKKAEDRGNISASFSDGATADIKNEPDFNPALGTFVIECVVKPYSPDGVIISAGSQREGWALFLEDGIPGFVVAHNRYLQFIDGTTGITGKWCHLFAVIENYNNIIRLYADGKLIGQRQMLLPIKAIKTEEGDISIGQDSGELIDPKVISIHKYEGLIKHITFYREKMSDSKIKELSVAN